MSEPHSRKRLAENQLGPTDADDHGGRDADEEFITTPQIASAEEMKTRRVVRVARPAGTTPSGSGATGGLFKGLSSSPAAGSTTGFDSKNPFGVVFATNIKPAFGSTSFGLPMATKTDAGDSAAPKAAETAPATTTPSFSFGTTTASTTSSTPPTGFSFGFGTAASAKKDEPTSKPATTDKAEAEGGAQPAKVFGSSAPFSFASAVGSFVEARKKMESDPKTADTAAETKPAPSDSESLAAADSSTLSQVAVDPSLETLLRAPVKLFLWKKDGDAHSWVESGVGDAQIVKQPHSTPEEPEKKSFIHRLLVRDGYSLNVLASKGHLEMGSTVGKKVTLTTLSQEGSATYALRFTNEENAKQFADKLAELVNVIRCDLSMEKIEELFRQNPNLARLLRPSTEELEGLAESIRALRAALQNEPENEALIFQLAGALISHSRLSYVEEGVRLMEGLAYRRWHDNWNSVVQEQRGPFSPPRADDFYSASTTAATSSVRRGVVNVGATAPPASDGDEVLDTEVSSSTSGDDLDDDVNTIEVSRPSTQRLSSLPPRPPPSSSSSATPRSKDTSAGPSTASRSSGARSDYIAPGMVDDLAVYHYYLSLGWIKLNEMDKARNSVTQMLLMAPGNKQGEAVKQYLDVAGRQSTAVDAAKIAGVSLLFAGAATVLSVVLRGRQSS